MRAARLLLAVIGVLVALAGAIVALACLGGVLYQMGLNTWMAPKVTGLHPLLDEALGEPTWTKFFGWLGGHMVGLVIFTLGRSLFRFARIGPRAGIEAGGARPCRGWTEAFCVGLIMIGVTYVNLVKNVETWTHAKPAPAMPETMYGLHAYWWFSVAYLAGLVAFVLLAIVHSYRRLAVIPERPLGKGEMLYLAFLWVMVIGNLMRAIPPFHQERLITEGVIIINAILCTVLVLTLAMTTRTPPEDPTSHYGGVLGKTIAIGLLGLVLSLGVETGIARLFWGDQQAGAGERQVRFGPEATAKGTPKPGQPHP